MKMPGKASGSGPTGFHASDASHSSSGSSTGTSKRRVLVVEDDENVTRLYQRVLSPRYDLVCVQNGVEAKRLIDQSSFDAVLSDIAMPEMDGIQLLQTVRQRDLDVPVVLVTGEPDVDTAAKALEYGALRYLMKPINIHELSEVMAYAIQVHELAKIQRRALALLGDNARSAAGRAGLTEDFKEALGRVWMSYQPIVSWTQRTTIAYEALVRSQHVPLSTPAALFDAAMRLGRVHDLGRAIRRRVAARVASLPNERLLFANLHASELHDEQLYGEDNPLAAYSQRVVFEITERASLDEIPDSRERLSRLRAMGFLLAVDDLGSGYAGLSSFVQLSPEIVKIDMSLVRDVHRDVPKQKLVKSILDVCRDMKIQVVSEGVETREERAVLVDLGADLLQGFLFARPSEALVDVPGGAFRESQ